MEIILIIGIIILGLFALRCLCLVFVVVAIGIFRSYTPEEQLYEFGTNLLKYKFSDGSYEVLEAISQNTHPDRLQRLMIKLNDDECHRLKTYINTLPEGECKENDNKYTYVTTIAKQEEGCTFNQEIRYLDSGYIRFVASAEIDYLSKTVLFESGYC